MTRRRTGAWLAPALALALASGVSGCFSEAPPISGSMEEATVKGTVRVRGKPVNNGIVSFRCANVNRPGVALKEAKIGKDGTYSVTTLLGENFVEVSCKELFTPKNRVLVENERMVKVGRGENTIDLDIPEQPAAKVE